MKAPPFHPFAFLAKRRRRRLIVIVAILLLIAAWIFRPHWHASQSRIDPRQRALQKPYLFVDSDVFDSGINHSVRIEITDNRGATEYFLITGEAPWQSVYIMPQRNSRTSEVPASNSAATGQELIAILADHCTDHDDYSNLASLTGRLGDRITLDLLGKWHYLVDMWKNL